MLMFIVNNRVEKYELHISYYLSWTLIFWNISIKIQFTFELSKNEYTYE